MKARWVVLVLLAVTSAATSTPLRTGQIELEIQNGVVTRLVNRLTGDVFTGKTSPPLTGIRHSKIGDMWNDCAQIEMHRTARQVVQNLRWRQANDINSLNTRFSALPSGDVVVTQRAQCVRPGLSGLQWGIVIPDDCELLVPAHSGLRFSVESGYEPMTLNYPMEWEAQFVLIQGKKGGILIHAEDNARFFKRLHIQHRDGQFWVGFETWCTAPFERIQQARSVPWRIRAYKGNWLVGARLYRAWAEKVFGLTALRKTQPAWVTSIQTVVIDNLDDIARVRALAKRLNPRQTLVYVPDWRKDGYDRNYPDYTPRPDFPERMAEAKRLGFRIMLHVNYFGCTPENPAYQQMKPYHFRDPFSGEPLYWDWQRADPPIKFAYINPAAKAWRTRFVQKMVELCKILQPDALHLDQTLCIYNDANGLIDGMNAMQGNIAIHRELRQALPDVALSGEGLNEISFRYESFAQRHVFGINHADMKWDIERVRQAHPVSSALLTPHTRLYGYLGMPNPRAWQYFSVWRTAYERFGVLPTFAWLWTDQVTQPDPAMQMLWQEAQWFGQNHPLPDFSPNLWDAGTVFVYRTARGQIARYRRDAAGVVLESPSTTRTERPTVVYRRIEGVNRAHVAGSIPNWPAYDGQTILGLNPNHSYPWHPQPPDLKATHVHSLSESTVLTGAWIQPGECAQFRFAPYEQSIPLWRHRGNVRACVTDAEGKEILLSGYLPDHETGGVARPTSEGIFMHPPWRRLAGGRVWLEYTLQLPADAPCEFRSGVGFTDSSAAVRSDGIIFTATVFGERDRSSISRHVRSATPEELTLDLSAYRGQKVRLRLEADPGPAGSPEFDWGYWSRPRLVVHREQQIDAEIASPEPFVGVSIGGLPHASWHRTGEGRYRFVLPPNNPQTVTLFYHRGHAIPVPCNLTSIPFSTGLEIDGISAPAMEYMRGEVAQGTVKGETRNGFSAHPPPVGKTVIAFLLQLPSDVVALRAFAGIRDGAEGKSNGVRFSVEVNGTTQWEQTVLPGTGWQPLEVSLSAWRGQTVLLRLITDPLDNFGWDWAHWADVRVE
ncbi:MAG: DUF6259 domain-containing protein [Armatimonadota bacterium]